MLVKPRVEKSEFCGVNCGSIGRVGGISGVRCGVPAELAVAVTPEHAKLMIWGDGDRRPPELLDEVRDHDEPYWTGGGSCSLFLLGLNGEGDSSTLSRPKGLRRRLGVELSCCMPREVLSSAPSWCLGMGLG